MRSIALQRASGIHRPPARWPAGAARGAELGRSAVEWPTADRLQTYRATLKSTQIALRLVGLLAPPQPYMRSPSMVRLNKLLVSVATCNCLPSIDKVPTQLATCRELLQVPARCRPSCLTTVRVRTSSVREKAASPLGPPLSGWSGECFDGLVAPACVAERLPCQIFGSTGTVCAS